MGEACGTHGRNDKLTQVLVEITEGKKNLG
jgi:hypothetical protein